MPQPFDAIPADRTATLPPAPARASIPAPSSHPDLAEIFERLAALHYTAFVTLYGPAPHGVTVYSVRIETGGDARPHYLAVAAADASPQALDWLEAFRAGLDDWAEAGMADPVTVIPSATEPDCVDLSIAEYDHIIVGASRRLKHAGRTHALRNLAGHLQGRLPGRYNPDHPDFRLRP